MPYLFLLVIPLLFCLVLVLRAVACESPHVRLMPMQRAEDVPALTDGAQGDAAPAFASEEKQTLLSCAARYSPDAMESFLAVSYPRIAARSRVQNISHSYLIRLKNAAPDAPSILCTALTGAQDVLLRRQSDMPLFSDGGAQDGAGRAVGILDALENLLSHGALFRANVCVLLAADESELAVVAEALKQNGESFVCALCEGGRIAPFGHNKNNRIAAVGVGVRAGAHFTLRACCNAENADAPGAASLIARAALRVEQKPFGELPGPSARRFARSALYENGFFSRIAAVNTSLFPFFIRRKIRKYGGRAAACTTARIESVACRTNGDVCEAEAALRCVLLPETDVYDLERRVRRRIHDDRINLALSGFDGEPVLSDENGFGYRAVQKAVALSFDRTNAAPVVLYHAPAARALSTLCSETIAFSPCGEGLAPDAQRIFFENFFLQLCGNDAMHS